MSLRIASAALLVAIVIGACSGSDGGVDGGVGGGAGGGQGAGQGGGTGGGNADASVDDGGVNLTPTTYCPKISDAFCTRISQCGRYALEHAGACFESSLAVCHQYVGEGLTSGLLELTPAATECVQGIKDAPCDLLDLTYDRFCDLPQARPVQATGEACSLPYGCSDGFCQTDAGSQQCGYCRGYLSLQSSCAPGQCNPDAGVCSTSLSGASVCRPWLADGQSCLATGSSVRCRSGLCLGRTDGGAFCGPLALGEQCADHRSCGPAAYCKNLVRSGQQPRDGFCATRISLGSACIDEELDDGCLGEDATCLDGGCVVAGLASRGAGQSCDELDQCVSGFYCKGRRTSPLRQGLCSPKLDVDAGCVATYPPECRDGLVCVAAACRPRAAFGEPCRATIQCESYAVCMTTAPDAGATCVPFASEGQRCPTTGACLNGYCATVPDAGYSVCTRYGDTGATCSLNSQCRSQSCAGPIGARTCSGGCF